MCEFQLLASDLQSQFIMVSQFLEQSGWEKKPSNSWELSDDWINDDWCDSISLFDLYFSCNIWYIDIFSLLRMLCHPALTGHTLHNSHYWTKNVFKH